MKKDLRLDETGFGKIKILQDPEGFCYGVDAVLLSDFAATSINGRRKKVERIMDLGTGTGIVPLILSHKTAAAVICGIELQKDSFELAERNISINELGSRIRFYNEDVADIAKSGRVIIAGNDVAETFDAVTTNPPYTISQNGVTSSNESKAIARHETTADLETFVKAAFVLLKDKGDLYMVHRPARLVDICESCRKYHMEPKELCFVSGKPMEKPNIILVHCVKNGNRELKVLEPLNVREKDGDFSAEMLKIYEKR